MDIKPHIKRLSLTLTIDEIAAAAGVDRATVVRAKAGKNITLATYNALAAVKPRITRRRQMVKQ